MLRFARSFYQVLFSGFTFLLYNLLHNIFDYNLGIFWFPNFALKMTNILAPGTIIYKAITGVSVSLNSISPMEVFA